MQGCCLERMAEIPDGSVDMILCDLPYGTTACKWDSVIPFEPLWAHYRRVTKKNAAIVLTASQPFTSALVMSNIEAFRYCWVWDKEIHANFACAKVQPLKVHEDVAVFSFSAHRYFPIKTKGAINHSRAGTPEKSREFLSSSTMKGALSDMSGMKFPKSIQRFPKHPSQCGLHPTQKPVDLMEYLIRTYTNEGETVLDNTMGSGTTGVACLNTGRRFIGIERDEMYFEIARKRIDESFAELKHDLFASANFSTCQLESSCLPQLKRQ